MATITVDAQTPSGALGHEAQIETKYRGSLPAVTVVKAPIGAACFVNIEALNTKRGAAIEAAAMAVVRCDPAKTGQSRGVRHGMTKSVMYYRA